VYLVELRTANMSSKRRLRYSDLKPRGIVNNRMTLRNWILKYGFPPGQLTGPNTRTWGEDEVDQYVATRPTAPKPPPAATRPRGRPRRPVAVEASAT
jgi:hypothetical protein